MSSMPREALKTSASKPGVIGVASSRLSALARAITSRGSEMSAGVILSPQRRRIAINHIWSLGQGRSLSRFQTARRQRAELGRPRALLGPETETFRVRFDTFGDNGE